MPAIAEAAAGTVEAAGEMPGTSRRDAGDAGDAGDADAADAGDAGIDATALRVGWGRSSVRTACEEAGTAWRSACAPGDGSTLLRLITGPPIVLGRCSIPDGTT